MALKVSDAVRAQVLRLGGQGLSVREIQARLKGKVSKSTAAAILAAGPAEAASAALPDPPRGTDPEDPDLSALEDELVEVRDKVKLARGGSLRGYLTAVQGYVGLVREVRKMRPPPPPERVSQEELLAARDLVLRKVREEIEAEEARVRQ